jgi:hypothetical protein
MLEDFLGEEDPRTIDGIIAIVESFMESKMRALVEKARERKAQ